MKFSLLENIHHSGKKLSRWFDKIDINILFFLPIIIGFFIPSLITLFKSSIFYTIPQEELNKIIGRILLFIWGFSGWALLLKRETPSSKYLPHQKIYASIFGIILIVGFWYLAFFY